MQYFFLNRRYIRDRALQHALLESYRGLLVSGRFPLAFLQIELPPDMFDVNVHPTKMEVRFLDSNRIYTGFLSAIREKFFTSDLRNKVHSSSLPNEERTTTHPPPWEVEEPQQTLDPSAAEQKRQAVQDWITQISNTEQSESASAPPSRSYDPLRPARSSDYSSLSIHHLPDRSVEPPLHCAQQNSPTPQEGHNSPISDLPSAVCRLPSTSSEGQGRLDRIAFSPAGHLVVQMLDRYLVMETSEGIAFIDQHALHERILYEQLKERMKTGRLESQRLLIPIPVDLSPNECSCVQENTGFFQTLGLQVEPFGGNTVLISAFPAVLSKTPAAEILSSLVEPFLTSGRKLSRDELLDTLLHSMACKAAVKAGDRLSSRSMQHLIQLAEAEINAHHCPHGRPSTLVFTQEELDKMFDRT